MIPPTETAGSLPGRDQTKVPGEDEGAGWAEDLRGLPESKPAQPSPVKHTVCLIGPISSLPLIHFITDYTVGPHQPPQARLTAYQATIRVIVMNRECIYTLQTNSGYSRQGY